MTSLRGRVAAWIAIGAVHLACSQALLALGEVLIRGASDEWMLTTEGLGLVSMLILFAALQMVGVICLAGAAGREGTERFGWDAEGGAVLGMVLVFSLGFSAADGFELFLSLNQTLAWALGASALVCALLDLRRSRRSRRSSARGGTAWAGGWSARSTAR